MEGSYSVGAAPMGDVGVGDLDGDGDLDLVGVSTPERMLFVLWNGIADRVTEIFEEERGRTPRVCRLGQNVPNPFNRSTTIPFQLAFGGRVVLNVYDVLGRKVRTLLDEQRSRGSWTVRWDGRDALGRAVGSGVYVVRMEVGDFVDTRRIVLLR